MSYMLCKSLYFALRVNREFLQYYLSDTVKSHYWVKRRNWLNFLIRSVTLAFIVTEKRYCKNFLIFIATILILMLLSLLCNVQKDCTHAIKLRKQSFSTDRYSHQDHEINCTRQFKIWTRIVLSPLRKWEVL